MSPSGLQFGYIRLNRTTIYQIGKESLRNGSMQIFYRYFDIDYYFNLSIITRYFCRHTVAMTHKLIFVVLQFP